MPSAIAMRPVTLVALGALQEACYLALLHLHDLRAHRIAFLGWIMAAALFYLIAAAVILRSPAAAAGDAGRERREVRFIVGMALLFRCTLLPLTPTLSTSLLRAHWDGKIQALGFNPYQYPPQTNLFNPVRSAAERGVEFPQVAATAPPLAELLARWNYAATAGLRREKLLYVGFDLLTLALLLGELRRRGLPPGRIALYAWAPLGVLEVAGSGHGEPVAIFFTVLALVWLGRRDRMAGLALVAAMASGYLAWAAAPAWLRRGRRAAWVWMALLAMLLLLPYVFVAQHVALPLAGNLGRWLALRPGWNAGPLARAALALLPARAGWATTLPASVAALATGLAMSRGGGRSDRAAWAAIAAALLLAPSLPPWYALWLLPAVTLFSPAAGGVAGLYFCAAVPLSYGVIHPAAGGAAGHASTWLPWIEYAPAYALLLASWMMRARRHLEMAA